MQNILLVSWTIPFIFKTDFLGAFTKDTLHSEHLHMTSLRPYLSEIEMMKLLFKEFWSRKVLIGIMQYGQSQMQCIAEYVATFHPQAFLLSD
jgi:hypothetical protein